MLTGPTGSGKTTLLSQLSLDLCDQVRLCARLCVFVIVCVFLCVCVCVE